MRALEGVLPWLPLVLALSANSPYLAGEETGLASARAEVLAQLPRAAAPPVFGSYAEWEAFVERFVADRAGRRLHALLVGRPAAPALRDARGARARPADRASSITAAFAALLQALCVTVARRRAAGARRIAATTRRTAGPRCASGRARSSIHPDGDRLVGVAELTDELLALVEPAARELGSPRRCCGDRPAQLRGRPPARGRPRAGPRGRRRGHRRADATIAARWRLGTETIQVSGIRCERCVGRLAGALRGHDGLEFANANLMGQVQLQWDDEQTDRDAILAAMAKAGFRPSSKPV